MRIIDAVPNLHEHPFHIIELLKLNRRLIPSAYRDYFYRCKSYREAGLIISRCGRWGWAWYPTHGNLSTVVRGTKFEHGSAKMLSKSDYLLRIESGMPDLNP